MLITALLLGGIVAVSVAMGLIMRRTPTRTTPQPPHTYVTSPITPPIPYSTNYSSPYTISSSSTSSNINNSDKDLYY